MASMTIERLAAEGPEFVAALEHYNRFVHTAPSTSVAPYKATEIKLISQEPGQANFLIFKLEYENPLDLLLLGHAVGVLSAEKALRPYLREGVRDGR